MENANFSHQFLIAMPDMADPRFAHSVTYIIEHNSHGAIGLVVNRPIDLPVVTLLGEIGKEPVAPQDKPDLPVLFGGPVEPQLGFVLHRQAGSWSSTIQAGEGVYVTNSRDILEAIARGHGPDDFLVVLGYAGWGPGQLEAEMAHNSWLNCPADDRIIFDIPFEQRWQAAAGKLGIDLSLLSHQVGHG